MFKNTLFSIDAVDSGVYSNNRSFRLPLCTKKGTNRHLKIITAHSFEDAILTFIQEDSELIEVREI